MPHSVWRQVYSDLFKEITDEGFSRMTYELKANGETVKLALTHTMHKKDLKLTKAASNGWPGILASLKSLLETGQQLPGTDRWPEGI